FRNRTDPSPRRKLAPPGWLLRKPNWPISRFSGANFQLTGPDWGQSGMRSFALRRGTVVARPWGRVTPGELTDWIGSAMFQTFNIGSGSLGKREDSPTKMVLLK